MKLHFRKHLTVNNYPQRSLKKDHDIFCCPQIKMAIVLWNIILLTLHYALDIADPSAQYEEQYCNHILTL